MGQRRNAYKTSVGKPEGMRPHGRPSSGWKDNAGMNLREIGWEVTDWMYLVQDRDQKWVLLNTVVKFHKRQGIY
jgi:hypothetical protein